MSKVESQKRSYVAPSLKTYTADELIATLGPAVAIYGPMNP